MSGSHFRDSPHKSRQSRCASQMRSGFVPRRYSDITSSYLKSFSVPALQALGILLPIDLLQCTHEIQDLLPVVGTVGAQHAGEVLLTVEGNPGKLAGLVVEETRGQADTLVGGHVGEGIVVVRGVDGVHMDRSNHPLLHGFQSIGRTASHHQGPSLQILRPD